MKKYLLIVLAAVMMIGCTRVNLKERYESVMNNARSAFENAETPQEAEDVFAAMLDTVYMLLDEHMGEPYSDSIFFEVY